MMDGLKNITVPHRSPLIPSFVSPVSRLKSFERWCGPINPEILVECGLFHSGIGDVVICFHCAARLDCWRDEDDVWICHSRWHPQCEFVLANKGPVYVREVRRIHSRLIESAFEDLIELAKKQGKVLDLNFLKNVPDEYLINKTIEQSKEIAKAMNSDKMEIEPRETVLCRICCEKEKNTVFLPCTHLLACSSCAVSVNKCPYCRLPVEGTFKTFIV
jgi:baculoviral IAP repeat-containing protein 7/8